MKRDIIFVKEQGVLAEALGLLPARAEIIETFVQHMIERKFTLRQIIEAMNERGDLTDTEWTVMIYTLAWYQCERRYA